MEIIHNKVIKIIAGPLGGIYRVILHEPIYDLAVLVNLDLNQSEMDRLNPSTKKPAIVSSYKRNKLLWLKKADLEALQEDSLIIEIDLQLSKHKLDTDLTNLEKQIFEKRVVAMQGFLTFDHLKKRLLIDQSLGGLVGDAIKISGYSKPQIYKLFSKLSQYGFTAKALRPEYYLSGAPGVKKPIGPKQKKLGKKSTKEKVFSEGGSKFNTQPGMSEEWRNLIIAGDHGIPLPKPSMPSRSKIILDASFVQEYEILNGVMVPKDLKIGTYPNIRQIERVLKAHYSSTEHFLHKTTQNNFILNHRGVVGKSWEGVAGPGHTYAIDSTIGDVYLRSALNPEWIIGRPIVYVIVDTWSTAVVGFYVCLSGPSWDMAKIALFCAIANPDLISKLRGMDSINSLFPHPTLPAVLLCDRGEYLSLGASATGVELKLSSLSYTPPYRGDLKGIAEVLHRIEKNAQFAFLPGAIDARRKEYEFQKYDNKKSLLTIREYTKYLHSVFTEYNLTADRSNRLDAHMKATDVHPSPAGLWRWGHEVGIGTQIHKDPSDLISSLLLESNASVTRNGLIFNRKQYNNRTDAEAAEAGIARNAGGWDKKIFHYPCSLSRIWTPDDNGQGMQELLLSDHSTASPETTLDEEEDAHAYHLSKKEPTNHHSLLISLGQLETRKIIVDEAKLNQNNIEKSYNTSIPSVRQARNLEKNSDLNINQATKSKPPHTPYEESLSKSHAEKLRSLLTPNDNKRST